MTDRFTPAIIKPQVKEVVLEGEETNLPELLNPDIIEKIKNFIFLAKNTVDGILNGVHKSYHLGQSVEFSQHKEYSQGDDLRDLDWKAFAKSDRYFIKQYDTETNARVVIIMDASDSMNFGTTGITKFDYAKQLTGALAFLFLQQYDETGVLICNSDGLKYITPHRGLRFFKEIATHLVISSTSGDARLLDAIRFVAEKLWRGIVILISDLIMDEERLVKEIRYLHSRKNDVMVLHLLDPAELTLNFSHAALFKGLEGEGEIHSDPEKIRRDYIKEIERIIDYYRYNFRMNDIYYMFVNTSSQLEKIISDIMIYRSGR